MYAYKNALQTMTMSEHVFSAIEINCRLSTSFVYTLTPYCINKSPTPIPHSLAGVDSKSKINFTSLFDINFQPLLVRATLL